jgi:hypothetical protein|tara:strand:+ start:99 stop:440 length:342 start_codon:yes stop_codon:yes gene_type:complete
MPTDNIWSRDFLEDFPDIAYEAYRPDRFNRPAEFPSAPNTFFDYYQNRQAQIEGGYFGQLGAQARAGQAPTATNVEFLANYPWMQRFLALSPQRRGAQSSQFGPRARWDIPGF